jgi:CspA family cold shock protein
MKNGIVKWFNSERGFGFICVDGEPDVFVHSTDCKKSGLLQDLEEGDAVLFETKSTPRGIKAVNVQLGSQ